MKTGDVPLANILYWLKPAIEDDGKYGLPISF